MSNGPFLMATWNFINPITQAWNLLKSENNSVKACVEGCRQCQIEQSDGTVGWGNSPNQNGETTLDAMVMEGDQMRVGCVGSLRNIKDAIGVAFDIMTKTEHSFLVGSEATEFAIKMGYTYESLTSKQSARKYSEWLENNRIPCYMKKSNLKDSEYATNNKLSLHHDTIGIVAIDLNGTVSSATSTNGKIFKIPGRVGDSPIPGAGSYCDSTVGGAAATGDGDVLLRFLPSFTAVEYLRQGFNSTEAAVLALKRIIRYDRNFSGAIVVLKNNGEHGIFI